MSDNITVSKINRLNFFNKVKALFFNGRLSQQQVDCMNAVLDEWEGRNLTDLRMLAYMFATIYHETGKTMQPIDEYGKGKGKAYGKPNSKGIIYYGRGFVQLTWESNYQKMENELGIHLVEHPELALFLNVATDILFAGMIKGMFTGKKLSDYFNDKKEDWVNARRIINILDKAELIAGYGKKFLTTLA